MRYVPHLRQRTTHNAQQQEINRRVTSVAVHSEKQSIQSNPQPGADTGGDKGRHLQYSITGVCKCKRPTNFAAYSERSCALQAKLTVRYMQKYSEFLVLRSEPLHRGFYLWTPLRLGRRPRSSAPTISGSAPVHKDKDHSVDLSSTEMYGNFEQVHRISTTDALFCPRCFVRASGASSCCCNKWSNFCVHGV